MNVLLKIFFQSLRMSLEEVRASKLRSFLSLLGITIGIICIISVRTAVTSLGQNIENSFATLGSDVIYIQKWPWIMTDENNYPWWRFFNRPNSTPKEMEMLKERLPQLLAACLINFAGEKSLKYEDRIAEKVQMRGVTYEYDKTKDIDFSQGRYFTQAEAAGSGNICLLGNKVAETLFEGITQIEGRDIRIDGIKMKVVGVISKQGEDIFNMSLDNSVLVPYYSLNQFVSQNTGDPLMALVPKPNSNIEELKLEIKGTMRSIRRLSPLQDDNFAINQLTVFTNAISQILGVVNIAGIFIGLISLLVGGFGIANIMFVSVKERTNIIGIKKALGAKQIYILLEFLLESVVLCILGGIIGLTIVLGIFYLLNFMADRSGSSFHFYITTFNLSLGIGISIFIGIVAGFIPAWSASRMKPVDAIRGN